MGKVKILAIVGMSGSGKSEVVSYLTEQGWARVYFGGIIIGEMKNRGIEVTPENEKIFREQVREEEGKDYVVVRAIENVKNLIQAGQKKIVLDGLYTWTEYKILRKEFGSDLILISLVTTKTIRHNRVANRPERPFDAEEINRRDWSEIENLEKGGPIAIADFYIHNDGSISNMHDQLDEITKNILQ